MQNFFIFFIFLELQNKLRRKCKKELYYKNIGVKQLKSSEWNYIKVRSGNIKKLGIKLQKSPEKFLLTDIHFVSELSEYSNCNKRKSVNLQLKQHFGYRKAITLHIVKSAKAYSNCHLPSMVGVNVTFLTLRS